MQLEFNVAKRDFIMFNQYHQWHSPNRKNYRLRTRLISGFSLSCLPYLFLHLTYQYAGWVLFLNSSIFAICLLLIGYFRAPNLMLALISETSSKYFNNPANKHIAGHMSFTFEPDVIKFKTNMSEGVLKYEAVRRIAETKEYFYLYASLEGAFIIPKSAFICPHELTDFTHFIAGKQAGIWKKTE